MAKITIFGMAGTGKTSTGKEVAKRLGYEFFSGGDFMRQTAAAMGLTLNQFEELNKTDSKYDLERDKTIEEFGKTHNNFIVEARLAWKFIPDSFRICFKCHLDERTRRIAGRENKDLEQVRHETRDREDSIYERFDKYYGLKDFEDSRNFDLIVDTEHNNFNQVVGIIMSSLKEKGVVQ